MEYRAPWQGQSHDNSAAFQAKLHFKCVQVGFNTCSLPSASLYKAILCLSNTTTFPSPCASSDNDSNWLRVTKPLTRLFTTSAFSFIKLTNPAIGFILLGSNNSL